MSKVKLLIVNESLAQGGSEKWIYEICKAIDKEKFEVGILTDKNYLFTDEARNFKNYHYHELKKMGVEMYEYLDLDVKRTPLGLGIHRAKRLVRHLLGKTKTKISPKVRDLLQTYDVVCIMDYYNYITLKEVIHKYCEERFFIVLHSNKAQFDFDPYAIFDKDKQYNFTYVSPIQIEEIKSTKLDVQKDNFFFNPLVSDLSGYEHIFNPITDEPIVISIFSRIANTRMNDQFIQAFAQIQQKLQHKSVLHIYGEIIDKDYYDHLQQLISSLNIESGSVKFMGHTKDMAASIKNDKVNVYWGHITNSSCGYSTIEIGAMGVPSFFWTWDEIGESENDDPDDNLMFLHNKLDGFVDSNLKYLSNNKLLAELSGKQREFFISRHHITGKIKDFENYVASFAKNSEKIRRKIASPSYL